MSLKKSVAKLEALVITLSEDERIALIGAANKAVRGMFDGFAEMRIAIPADRLALFGAALTDVVTSAMIAYGIAYVHPLKKLPPAETVGAELQLALGPCVGMPALLGPIAARLTG